LCISHNKVRNMPKASPEIADHKAKARPSKSTEQRDAYSIPEFCRRHNISTGTYYNLRNLGRGPREARAMNRVLITKEAAADWRRECESIETTTT
jgi:hypothetical protein